MQWEPGVKVQDPGKRDHGLGYYEFLTTNNYQLTTCFWIFSSCTM